MNILLKVLKRYKIFLISLLVLIITYLFNNSLGFKVFESAKSSLSQMLSSVPPIMIILGLIDVWIPKKILMKYMGNNSGIIGIIFAIIIGSIGCGPMYAAFPLTAILIKKGVKFSNIIIFINTWCVIKISTVLFEISALGIKFTFIRLIIDIPGVIIMGYLVEYFMDKNTLKDIYS